MKTILRRTAVLIHRWATICYPIYYRQKKKGNEYRCLGNATQTIFEAKSQIALLQFANKR